MKIFLQVLLIFAILYFLNPLAFEKFDNGKGSIDNLTHKELPICEINNDNEWISSNPDDPISSPISGWEPPFNGKKWNIGGNVQKYNNCYAYAFNNLKQDRSSKPSPGNTINDAISFSMLKKKNKKYFTCKDVENRLFRDNPKAFKTHFNSKCPEKFNKVFLAVSKEPNTDFHFYRQDNPCDIPPSVDGDIAADLNNKCRDNPTICNEVSYWSHKPGSLKCTNKDASGNIIINPLKSDRNYKSYNYKCPCGFYCVPCEGAEFFSQ